MRGRFAGKNPVYLCCVAVDMRKAIDGLAAIVQGHFKLDPFSGALFLFCNRRRDKLKVLQWDKDGFVLYYKRRERGSFAFPKPSQDQAHMQITRSDLNRLLDGLIMECSIPKRDYRVV